LELLGNICNTRDMKRPPRWAADVQEMPMEWAFVLGSGGRI
jgi:hypothetical protein